MTKNPTLNYGSRRATIVDLPLSETVSLLHPENIVLRFNGRAFDIGAYCYTVRSQKVRKANSAGDVVLASFNKERVSQVRALIKTLSRLLTEGGLRQTTIHNHCNSLKDFIDWADANGHHDCLLGGESTRKAYRGYVENVDDRYRRHKFGSAAGFNRQKHVLTILENCTGIVDLVKGVRLIRIDTKASKPTEPVHQEDFAHALALNDALFKGLCDMVLGDKPFPYRLPLPESLGWKEHHLWIFPSSQWFQHPTDHGKSSDKCNVYDYRNGCLSNEDDIWQRYQGEREGEQRSRTRSALSSAKATIAEANGDSWAYYRLMLANVAQEAFLVLFLANTGGNLQTILDIETDDVLDETAVNQGYRSIKWRAGGKEVDLVVPVAFMPSLRRFMELRSYLLNGTNCPNLFFSRGPYRIDQPRKMGVAVIPKIYAILRRIDPAMPRMGAKKIRATVSDYYQRQHDASVTASVLQNTEATSLRNYNAGTVADQQVEVSLVLQRIAEKARTQVVSPKGLPNNARALEDGGVCPSYGQPQALSEEGPVIPNCKTGCLFCAKRVLIAGEEDTRKVASAAFVMERLIMGPLSEMEYRPQIEKCDQDLAMLRSFDGCADMVDRVKNDVYENGNLTPYFADKYQLFLSLGVL